MKIRLSDHFTYSRLIRFTLPSIAMMLFTSVYGIVDGFFVSNYVGKIPFAALNFIMPFLFLPASLGFMFGAGGGALVAKTLGQNDQPKAKQLFSLFVYVPFALSLINTVVCMAVLPSVVTLLGATGEMRRLSILYGRIVLCALPAFTLQMEFQNFFSTAEKPQLGFINTVIAGVTNMILDALFVAVFRWGLAGAAAATAIAQGVGGLLPIVYFALPNSSLLRLTRTHCDFSALWKATSNGFSELLSNISMSLVGLLYNVQLMKYAGENGVAAYGTVMYIDMIFFSLFIGYAMGSAPVIGFHYGAENHGELKSLLRKSTVLNSVAGLLMFTAAELAARPLTMIFSRHDTVLMNMTVHGFRIYSLSFLFCGLAIFASSFFTALNNGLISAVISFLRTCVLEVAGVLLLPLIWGMDGIWISIVLARFLAMLLSVAFIFRLRPQYHY